MAAQLSRGGGCGLYIAGSSRQQRSRRIPTASSPSVFCSRQIAGAFGSPRLSALVCRAASDPSGLSASDRPAASPETLCKLAREFIETGSGYFSPGREELFSEDFVFRGPVIGPLNKKDYLLTLDGSFKVYNWFPDIQSNSWGYSVDPLEPNRVWFFVRQTGTNTGALTFGPLLTMEATGRKAAVGPEAYSVMFDDDLKVKLLTVGYACDFDSPNTNSNKYGAVVGLLKAVGVNQPPQGKVLAPVQALSAALMNAGLLPENSPLSYSKWEDVPQWYKDYTPRRIGTEDAPGY